MFAGLICIGEEGVIVSAGTEFFISVDVPLEKLGHLRYNSYNRQVGAACRLVRK